MKRDFLGNRPTLRAAAVLWAKPLKAKGGPGRMALAMANQKALRAFALDLQQRGSSYVGLDVVIKKGKVEGRFYPIDEFIALIPSERHCQNN